MDIERGSIYFLIIFIFFTATSIAIAKAQTKAAAAGTCCSDNHLQLRQVTDWLANERISKVVISQRSMTVDLSIGAFVGKLIGLPAVGCCPMRSSFSYAKCGLTAYTCTLGYLAHHTHPANW